MKIVPCLLSLFFLMLSSTTLAEKCGQDERLFTATDNHSVCVWRPIREYLVCLQSGPGKGQILIKTAESSDKSAKLEISGGGKTPIGFEAKGQAAKSDAQKTVQTVEQQYPDHGARCAALANALVKAVSLTPPTAGSISRNEKQAESRPLVPVGTIMAYAGPLVDETTKQRLDEQGWLLCDGKPRPRKGKYAKLFDTIGTSWGSGDGVDTFNPPDLRGLFLRGADLGADRDPDRLARKPISEGGNYGDKVGSLQGTATARPSAPFTTNETGLHSHKHDLETTASRAWEGGKTVSNTVAFPFVGNRNAPTSEDGKHSHSVTGGGDQETRPINVYVNWIVRYR